MSMAAKSLLLIFTLVAIPFATRAQANSRENFAQAYALYSSGSFAQAKELFQLASDPDFPLADYSLYYLALIAHKEVSLPTQEPLSPKYLGLSRGAAASQNKLGGKEIYPGG
jgi:hypothetical protein